MIAVNRDHDPARLAREVPQHGLEFENFALVDRIGPILCLNDSTVSNAAQCEFPVDIDLMFCLRSVRPNLTPFGPTIPRYARSFLTPAPPARLYLFSRIP